jgi:sugar lactone lactonase YvrE
MPRPHYASLATLTWLALSTGACRPAQDKPPAADSVATMPAAPPAPSKVGETSGFSTPESALWDRDQGVWFVSNINGNPSQKDNNGFIARLTKAGAIDSLHFIQAGRGGMTLNGPKGLGIVGDTLWVADIDAVRGFNRRTGALVASIEVGSRAHFLNDVAIGPNGSIYITDTGVIFDAKGQPSHPGPDRIYQITGRKVTVAAEGAWLESPNGITWDGANARFILVPFGGTHLLGWKPGEAKADTLGTGPGMQDGVELWNGNPIITSWTDSTIFVLEHGATRKLITGQNAPADIGLDQERGLLAIPRFQDNKVEFWSLK